MSKKTKPELPKRVTARDWIASQTGTDPEDWERVSTGTARYRKGYRFHNRKTNQWARRPCV